MGSRKVSVPVVELYNIKELQGMEFEVLVEQYKSAKYNKETEEAEQKQIGVELLALMTAVDQTRVGVGGYVAMRIPGRSGGRLNEHKLVEAGVDPDVIAKCWDGGKEYEYVQIRKRGEEDKYEDRH